MACATRSIRVWSFEGCSRREVRCFCKHPGYWPLKFEYYRTLRVNLSQSAELRERERVTEIAAIGANKTALVVLGTINYYYDMIGERVAVALRVLGYTVTVAPLRTVPGAHYDWCFFVNLYEVCVGYGGYGAVDEAVDRVRSLVADSEHSATVLLECVATRWYAESYRLTERCGIPVLLDLGFHDQAAMVDPNMRKGYRFAFNGLLRTEIPSVRALLDAPLPRPVPWTFVGHLEPKRVKFVERLMNRLDTNGFVYLPTLAHMKADGPHLNADQLRAALRRTRYYVWCAHHDYFYIESERFKDALFAGAVPIKVLQTPLTAEQSAIVPFGYVLLDDADFDTRLAAMDFEAIHRRYIEDFCVLPTLEDELAVVIGEAAGLPIAGEPAHA